MAAGDRTVFLKTLIETFPEAMLGEAHVAQYGKNLGVLCKLLDAAMRLSIQTHPNRAFARQHLQSEFGKTESWIIIGTREIEGELPYILLGFRDGVTEADFRRITELQDTQAQIRALNRIAVHPGDVYLVPAGIPHAIGAGVFMIEVQEPTDFTVNIELNYGGVQRTERQCFLGLGFDLGMRCFDYGTGGMSCVQQNTLIPRTVRQDAQSREEILIGPEHTKYFGASRLVIRRTAADRVHGECYIGIVIQGCGQILSSTSEALPLRPGSAFFVPAASRHEAIQADPSTPLTLIRCFPPGKPARRSPSFDSLNFGDTIPVASEPSKEGAGPSDTTKASRVAWKSPIGFPCARGAGEGDAARAGLYTRHRLRVCYAKFAARALGRLDRTPSPVTVVRLAASERSSC